MGGHGSGGHPSVGRKPEEIFEETPLPVIDPPSDLAPDQLAVWDRLAPQARERRTLTVATAERFRLLCKAIAMESSMSQKLAEDGWTYISTTIDGAGNERETLKAHPLCGPHRGMMQRVEAGLAAFRLAAIGKPLAGPKEKQQSALDKLQAQRPAIRAIK